MRIKIMNRESKPKGRRGHDSASIFEKAKLLPFHKKMVIVTGKDHVLIRDRVYNYNRMHDLGFSVTSKKGIVEIMKLHKHRVTVLGNKEEHAKEHTAKYETSEPSSAEMSKV